MSDSISNTKNDILSLAGQNSDFKLIDIKGLESYHANAKNMFLYTDNNGNVNKTNLKIGNVEIQSGNVHYNLFVEEIITIDNTIYQNITAEFTGRYVSYETEDTEDDEDNDTPDKTNRGVAMVFEPTAGVSEDAGRPFEYTLYVKVNSWNNNTTSDIIMDTVWAEWDEGADFAIANYVGAVLTRTFIQTLNNGTPASNLLVNNVPVALVTDIPVIPNGILTINNDNKLNTNNLIIGYQQWDQYEDNIHNYNVLNINGNLTELKSYRIDSDGGEGLISESYITLNEDNIKIGVINHTEGLGQSETYIDVNTDRITYVKSGEETSEKTYDEIATIRDISNHLNNYYTKSKVYNKSEIDNKSNNYYTKSEVYNKSEIDNKIDNIASISEIDALFDDLNIDYDPMES